MLAPGVTVAQRAGKLKADKLRDDGTQLQPKMPSDKRNPCAEYGAGFAPVAGTSTCAKIGGSIGIGVGTGNGTTRIVR